MSEFVGMCMDCGWGFVSQTERLHHTCRVPLEFEIPVEVNARSRMLNDTVKEIFKALPKHDMAVSPTGGLRDNKGKLPLSWVPLCIIEAITAVLYRNSTAGGGKYPEHNWKKGAQHSVPMDSLMRHAFKRSSGELTDPDDGLPHSWKILTNAAFLVFYEKFYPELNDLKAHINKESK